MREWQIMLCIAGGVTMLIALTLWPFVYLGGRESIKAFQTVEQSVINARANSNVTPMELAALQHKIIDANKWLAGQQYWNALPIFELYIPGTTDNLELIK